MKLATLNSKPRPEAGPTWHELSQQRGHRFRNLFSLHGRLLLYFTILVFGSVGASTWLLALRGQTVAARSLADVATSVARSLATSAAATDADRASLQIIADSQLAGEQILAVAFVDSSGTTIASAARPNIDVAAFVNDLLNTPHGVDTAVGGAIAVTTPMLVSPTVPHPNRDAAAAGRVIVIASTHSLDGSTRAMLELIALVGSGVTLTAAMLTTILLNRARRPLKDLVTSVRSVIAGDADQLAEVGDNEQATELTIAFNELIINLRTNRGQLAVANEELARLIQDLEKKVADRTAQLESANDRLSGEIAEKEDFLRAVSHDLNAPLRNIGGMVSMLMLKNKDQLPADVVQRLERIRKNVDVETDLINELLELSRIKTRRQTLELVDTESVVWELRGTFENDLKTRHIDVILETSLPPLYAERARVRQIFQNLIDNAIKYMGDGPVREIRIGCSVSVTEAAFYVRDTGLGIHPEDIDKVFFVFRRGRGEVSQKVAGKGVGLSSVKSIVETYAGQIRVESTLGSGSTFHFTVNGKYVPSVAGQVPAEMGSQPTQPTPTLASAQPSTENRAA